jgi:hypothetical protein
MSRWKYILRLARARLLPRPLKRIFSQIAKHQSISKLSVLELFARTGEWHTIEYSTRVKNLELWEIDASLESILAKRFPKATICIGDTYDNLLSSPKKFDVLISDNPISRHGTHHEHFDLFPSVFEWLADNSFLIVNIIPIVDEEARRVYPSAFDYDHMQDRQTFYGSADSQRIPISDVISRYRSLCEAAGWEVLETAVEPRNAVMNYLLLVLRNERGRRPEIAQYFKGSWTEPTALTLLSMAENTVV